MAAKRTVFPLSIALAVFAADFASKSCIMRTFALGEGKAVVKGFFNIVRVHNRGAAFGFLNSPDINWQFWLFFAATLAALAVIVRMIMTSKWDAVLYCGFGLIVGGAAGNLLDRLRFRYVVDFLDFCWGDLHFPAFNIADSAICLGTFLVAWCMLFRLNLQGSESGGE